MTIEQFRIIIAEYKSCGYCGNIVTRSNWSLDRMDNTKSHSFDNLTLCCQKCNAKKKDRQQNFYIWECETMPDENGNHHIYGVSLVEYNIRLLNKENFAAVKKENNRAIWIGRISAVRELDQRSSE